MSQINLKSNRFMLPKLLVLLPLLSTTSTTIYSHDLGSSRSGDVRKSHAREKKEFSHLSFKEDKLSVISGGQSVTISGSIRVDGYFFDNAGLLNKKVPDQIEYFKQVVDLDLVYDRTIDRFEDKVIEAKIQIRNKNKWGTYGMYAESSGASISIVDTQLGSHSHESSRPIVWLREAWIQLYLNAISNSDSKKKHYLKIGWYPFQLGRGISFGSNFGASSDF